MRSCLIGVIQVRLSVGLSKHDPEIVDRVAAVQPDDVCNMSRIDTREDKRRKSKDHHSVVSGKPRSKAL